MNAETRGFGEAEMQETVLPTWLEIEERKTEIRCLRGVFDVYITQLSGR
jgi:hypothetical protein